MEFISNEILKEALELYAEDLCAAFPTDEECAHITFSPRFEKRMERLLRNHQKVYYFWFNTVGKRVASVLVGLAVTLAIATVSVKALREGFIEFITKTYEWFTAISVNYEGDIPQTVEPTEPAYLPEGYTIKSRIQADLSYKIHYQSMTGDLIVFGQDSLSNKKTIDTENAEYRAIDVNGYEGMLSRKNGTVSLVFCDERYMYTLIGAIDEDEIIKIAKSIPLK